MNAKLMMIKQQCFKCGHNRFKDIRLIKKCAKCGSLPTKLVEVKNKYGKSYNRVVEE